MEETHFIAMVSWAHVEGESEGKEEERLFLELRQAWLV